MGAGRKPQTFLFDETLPSSARQTSDIAMARNLAKSNLGGIIFGCKNSTIKECLSKQLFGLPAQHFPYVKNISPGLPLFLFNYSDRKLHGIFEAASSGQMNINPYAWTSDGSERTLYPAQVQVRIKLQCQPLSEDQFKPIILDNYYNPHHFWFELDYGQANRLLSKLSTMAIAPGSFVPMDVTKRRTSNRKLPSNNKAEESRDRKLPVLQSIYDDYYNSNKNVGTSDSSVSSDDQNGPTESPSTDDMADRDAKDLFYLQLKELALNCKGLDASMKGHEVEIAIASDQSLGQQSSHAGDAISVEKNENNGRGSIDTPDYPAVIAQLLQEMEELKAFKKEQIQKADRMEQKLLEAEEEIRQLKSRYMLLDSTSSPPLVHVDATGNKSLDDIQLDLDESIFLVGGYDGVSWLSALDMYSPSQDVLKSLKPMNSVRSYSSVVKLNGELYVFGGGNGCLWYDTVESYNPAANQWSLCPSLNQKKGSLAGATLNNKIFAIGGGNGLECFSEVEMYDPYVGRWISTRSMLQKRFALAAADLNGSLYAVGGYDGDNYLQSAERFDPREHSWSRIDGMNTRRGCHSLVVMNEKLYALGGYDGSAMSASVEVYDPRHGKWMTGEPMDQLRGYLAAAALKETIYVIGGVKSGDDIVDTIECYKDGQGWQVTNLKAIGRRCFCSAIVLGD